MTAAEQEPAPSYDVTVEGVIGPDVRAALRDVCAMRTSESALIRLRCETDWDPADLTEQLEGRGLSVISIRVLPGTDDT
jgi:hypothetical protein